MNQCRANVKSVLYARNTFHCVYTFIGIRSLMGIRIFGKYLSKCFVNPINLIILRDLNTGY